MAAIITGEFRILAVITSNFRMLGFITGEIHMLAMLSIRMRSDSYYPCVLEILLLIWPMVCVQTLSDNIFRNFDENKDKISRYCRTFYATISYKNYGKNCFLDKFLFLPPSLS